MSFDIDLLMEESEASRKSYKVGSQTVYFRIIPLKEYLSIQRMFEVDSRNIAIEQLADQKKDLEKEEPNEAIMKMSREEFEKAGKPDKYVEPKNRYEQELSFAAEHAGIGLVSLKLLETKDGIPLYDTIPKEKHVLFVSMIQRDPVLLLEIKNWIVETLIRPFKDIEKEKKPSRISKKRRGSAGS